MFHIKDKGPTGYGSGCSVIQLHSMRDQSVFWNHIMKTYHHSDSKLNYWTEPKVTERCGYVHWAITSETGHGPSFFQRTMFHFPIHHDIDSWVAACVCVSGNIMIVSLITGPLPTRKYNPLRCQHHFHEGADNRKDKNTDISYVRSICYIPSLENVCLGRACRQPSNYETCP